MPFTTSHVPTSTRTFPTRLDLEFSFLFNPPSDPTPRWLFGVEHSTLGAVIESMQKHDIMLFLVLLVLDDYPTTVYMLCIY